LEVNQLSGAVCGAVNLVSGLLNVGGVRGSARCQYRPVAVVADVAATSNNSNNNSNSSSNSVLSASASVHELRITHRFDYQQPPHGCADEQASSGPPAAAAVVMTTSDNNDDSPAKTNKKNKQKKSYQLPAGTAS